MRTLISPPNYTLSHRWMCSFLHIKTISMHRTWNLDVRCKQEPKQASVSRRMMCSTRSSEEGNEAKSSRSRWETKKGTWNGCAAGWFNASITSDRKANHKLWAVCNKRTYLSMIFTGHLSISRNFHEESAIAPDRITWYVFFSVLSCLR